MVYLYVFISQFFHYLRIWRVGNSLIDGSDLLAKPYKWLWLLNTSSCNISGQNVSIYWPLLQTLHDLKVLQPHQPLWSPQNSLWFNDTVHVLGDLNQMQQSDEVSGVLSRVIQSLCFLCWPHCSYWGWSPQLPSPGYPGPFLPSQPLSAQPAVLSRSLCIVLGDWLGVPFGNPVLVFLNSRCQFSLEESAKLFNRESFPPCPCEKYLKEDRPQDRA